MLVVKKAIAQNLKVSNVDKKLIEEKMTETLRKTSILANYALFNYE